MAFFSLLISLFASLALGIVVSSPTAVDSLDPTEAEDFVTVRLLMNLGTGLVRYDRDLKIISGMAKSWNYSKDKKTIYFELGSYQWQDGRPIEAGDFEYGINRIHKGKAKLAQSLRDILQSVEAPSKSKLVVQLKKPAPYAIFLFALPFTFPQRQDKDYSKLSSGSFLIESFVRGSHVRLAPNPKAILPAKNKITLRFIREPQTSVQLYKKGDVDIVERVPMATYEEFKSKIDLQNGPFLATYYLGFQNAKGPLSPKPLRQALIQAIDRASLMKVLKPPQKSASSFVPSPLEGSQNSFGYSFNPTQAKDLWKNHKGPRELDFYFDGQERNRLVAQFLQMELKKNLDVTLKLREREWRSFLSSLPGGGFSFFRFAWLAPFPDPLASLLIFQSTNPNNHIGFKNKEYDQYLSELEVLEPGPKRSPLIQKAQEVLLTHEAALLPLFHYQEFYLIRPQMTGVDLTPMGILYLDKAHLEP